MTCSYCGKKFEGKSCPACGAPAPEVLKTEAPQTKEVIREVPRENATKAAKRKEVAQPPCAKVTVWSMALLLFIFAVFFSICGLSASVSIVVAAIFGFFVYVGIAVDRKKYGLSSSKFIISAVVCVLLAIGALSPSKETKPTSSTDKSGSVSSSSLQASSEQSSESGFVAGFERGFSGTQSADSDSETDVEPQSTAEKLDGASSADENSGKSESSESAATKRGRELAEELNEKLFGSESVAENSSKNSSDAKSAQKPESTSKAENKASETTQDFSFSKPSVKEDKEFGVVTVVAEITNNTANSYDFVSVTINFYDSDKNIIDSASAMIQSLSSGQTKSFSIPKFMSMDNVAYQKLQVDYTM